MRGLIILCLLAVPATASAQIVGRPNYGNPYRSSPMFLPDSSGPRASVGAQVRDVRDRINDARRDGRITRAQARALRFDADRIERDARRYRRGGLNDVEREDLEGRAAALGGRIGS